VTSASTASFQDYAQRLGAVLARTDWAMIEPLHDALLDAWRTRKQVFVAGNGGSGGNANHIANDLLYPVSKRIGSGLRIHALTENAATLTCLANDEGYDAIFSAQLAVLADRGDLFIALSGSGNSPNILKGLDEARRLGLQTFAILGYGGGKAKALCGHAIHFPVDDMQIAEDLQMIVFNMLMQRLYSQRDTVAARS
jgi:D-sedoheptulose 7-phosphate isomerase